MQTELVTIFGKHAVYEALQSRPDVVREVYISEEGIPPELARLVQKYGIKQLPLTPKRLKDLSPDTVHQGIAAAVDSEALMQKYEDFIAGSTISNDTSYILLGEVQDPQNVGSIIRSAAAFGVSAILFPQHRQVQVSGTVVKVSAGMAT
jgi:23S rRNA (guanosine2251-2'-O)-methyltransferase